MTKTYENIDSAFQALTDLEILDDENNYPIAKIRVPGMHEIVIQMLSEYDYFYILCPMRETFLNYWINKLAITEEQVDKNKLVEKIKNLVTDIESIKTKSDFASKVNSFTYLFEDIKIRLSFFKNLKRMKIIKWYVTWWKYQKIMRPVDTIMIFVYLWLFNFDGVKKNVKILLARTGVGTNCHSSTIYNNSRDWESYKIRLAEADKRLREHLKN